MGRGKAKGWRPPAANDASLLLGSADSCTGNTIASPVQLRQEGIPMPKEHMNYGGRCRDDVDKGLGTGKGGKRDAAGTVKGFAPSEPKPKDSSSVALPTPKVPSVAKEVAPSPQAHSSVEKTIEPPKGDPAKTETTGPVERKLEVKAEPVEVKSEIQRRWEALAAMRKAQNAVSQDREEKSEIMRRVEAFEAATLKEEPAFRLKEEHDNGHSATGAAEKQEIRPEAFCDVKTELEDTSKEEVKMEKVEETEHAASLGSAAKRIRAEDNECSIPPAPAAVPAPKQVAATPTSTTAVAPKAGTATQQGLQRWASQVNALAGSDADLVRKCREFVRKRILRAHAAGNLHATNWEKEPVPSLETLRADAS